MPINPLKTWWPAATAAVSIAVCMAVFATPALATDQVRTLPVFTGINSQGAFSLTIHAGQKQSVTMSGSDAALAKVESKVVDGVLVLSMPERSYSNSDDNKVRVTVYVETLTQFQMEGAGKTQLNNLSGTRFRLGYEGVGLVQATGKVDTLVLKAEGVGSVDTSALEAKHVDVHLQGVGSVKVHAKESLRAKVEGIGSLTYYGKPTRISKSVDGIGSIRAGD